MGLGGPMTWWDPDCCAMLAAPRLLRDPLRQPRHRPLHREPRAGSPAGCSCEAFAGRRTHGAVLACATWPTTPSACSTTSGSARAHVVGVSMGGMIVQTMAIERPDPGALADRASCRPPASARSAGSTRALMPAMLPPGQAGPRGVRRRQRRMWTDDRLAGLPPARRAHPRAAGETFDRGVSASGVAAPDAGDPDPAQPVARPCTALRMPTLVVHGLADKMVHVSGGRATAARHPRRRAAARRRHGPRPARPSSTRPSSTRSDVRRTGPTSRAGAGPPASG